MTWEIKKEAEQTSYQTVHTFDVPAQTEQIKIQYTLKQVSWLRFLVFDDKGILRAQKSGIASTGSVRILDTDSIQRTDIEEIKDLSFQLGDLNTLPGAIHEGQWRIEYKLNISDKQETEAILGEIDVEYLTGEQVSTASNHRPYEVSWKKEGASVFELDEAVLERTLETTARWYKGDFHTHTVFSDGKLTREQNTEQAVKQGLDFFVATDHDLMPTSWPLSFNCLVLPGVEVTSEFGHYNRLFGLTHPFQDKGYRVLDEEIEFVSSFDKQTEEQHLNSVNHPFLTEWKWLAETLPLSKMDSLEIWNDPTYKDNIEATEMALKTWDRLLEDGHKITGIGGSDSHLLPVERYPQSSLPSVIGDPATYVWSEALNGRALKAGVATGKVFVSRFGYEIDLTVNGGTIGDHFSDWDADVSASCMVKAPSDSADIQIDWTLDGSVVTTTNQKEDNQVFTLDPSQYHYIRVTVRSSEGELLAFSNPVFFGEKEPELLTWKDVVESV